MSQPALPFAWPAAADERDFLVGEANRAAVQHFEHWSLWPVRATLLVGPRKSGRSLLARIFATKTDGELVDDAEERDEEEVFHAWNRAHERRRPLVMVAGEGPWTPVLPDLRSRLAATPRTAIREPDEALAAQLIEKLCHVRGLAAPPELIRYLVPRIERSYVGLNRTVDALDELALEKRQGLTVPLAREALKAMGLIAAQKDLPL